MDWNQWRTVFKRWWLLGLGILLLSAVAISKSYTLEVLKDENETLKAENEALKAANRKLKVEKEFFGLGLESAVVILEELAELIKRLPAAEAVTELKETFRLLDMESLKKGFPVRKK